jgi:hypothetical protein
MRHRSKTMQRTKFSVRLLIELAIDAVIAAAIAVFLYSIHTKG